MITSPTLMQRLHGNQDDSAWKDLVTLYTPLIRNWLRRHAVNPNDTEDLVQEVLEVVVKRFPDFQHNQRTGAFRAWLKTITLNCVRDFWKANRFRPLMTGGSDFGGYLDQLADPQNPLSIAWDREHDLHVMNRLLEMIQVQFEESSWLAFKRVALDGASPDEVAKSLGITVNAVFIAKSRVLARLRQEAAGLIETN
jgi:RNA polymerase sigma-70 factor, ECF subfamily